MIDDKAALAADLRALADRIEAAEDLSDWTAFRADDGEQFAIAVSPRSLLTSVLADELESGRGRVVLPARAGA